MWSISDVTVRFGELTALDEVSLELEPGRLHGVVGGDGAGKSTLLKVVAGLDLGQTGSIHLPDPDRITYMPTDGGIFGDLTVDENMEFVASAYRLRGWRDRASELLARAGIGAFGDRLSGHLSGGQRRKLATCMALLPELDLLVLDELSTGVDPLSRQELWHLVTGAVASGAAVVAATTYLDEAERMDPVLLLHRGRSLGLGSPAELEASVPGVVVDCDQPDDRATAWRHGGRWRQWYPGQPRSSTDRLDLEEAAIVLELEQSDTDRTNLPAPAPARAHTARNPGSNSVNAGGAPNPSPASAPSPLLEASTVTKRFGSFVAVDNVSLRVEPGEIVGLLGANGAGKTTLMRMLLGLLEPNAGLVSILGGPHTREKRRRIGYVPQSLGLYADLTEAENLRFRAKVYGADEPPELPARSRLLGDYAVGDQRSVAFAAATQHNPELLILDEPTSGVSPLARSRLWDLVHERAERGVGVLASTHYMDEATQADRLIIMVKGRVVATGAADDIIGDRTVTEVVSPRWADAFAVLDRSPYDLRLAGTRIRVLAPVDAVTVALTDGGMAVDGDGAAVGATEVRSVPATLEEVLIDLDRGDVRWPVAAS
jgi:ABC-2 type transport system ATP-binding protein